MHPNLELIDVLAPPHFLPTGEVKTVHQAHLDGDWVGIFQLCIVQTLPVPAVVYQIRSHHSRFAPGAFDISGGHYQPGERGTDGLREIREEMGKREKLNVQVFIGDF